MKKIHCIVCIVVFGLIISCNPIGERNDELEQVRKHYTVSDSLSRLSLTFLINNLDEKMSYNGKTYDTLLNAIDSITKIGDTAKLYVDHLNQFFEINYPSGFSPSLANDRHTLSAKLLIENIDYAVDVFKTAAWCKDIDTSIFLEYILPYKASNERVQSFRPNYINKFHSLLEKRLTLIDAADSVLENLSQKRMNIETYPFPFPDLPLSTLQHIHTGSCSESSHLAIYAMRALGIPAAIDFTPQWPNRALGHSWSALVISEDSCINFEGSNSKQIEVGKWPKIPAKMAKVFRKTFSEQKETKPLKEAKEFIPELFTNFYMKDVSSQYVQTSDVELELTENIKSRFAYLCVFNNKEWVPIQWTEIHNQKALFKKMGRSIVYLPAVFENNLLTPFDYPLLLDSTGVFKKLIPQENSKREVRLKRKYPVFDWWNTRNQALQGGVFETSNDPAFLSRKILYRVSKAPEMTYQEVKINNDQSYQYFRYKAPDSTEGDIAEIELYDTGGHKLMGEISGSCPNNVKTKPEMAFDNNPLTYFQGCRFYDNWVSIKFDKPVRIGTLRYLCRNDDNFIKRNEVYELFYWKDNNGWATLGQQVGGISQQLTYAEVPDKCLLLLRNLTKGKEERIFTYESNRQVWW